jgi:thioredoxin-related protein
MNLMLLALRVTLAGVFAIAGLAKLFDRAGSRQSMHEFGIPNVLVPAVSVILPLGELACSVALIVGASAWSGAFGALALLAIFIAAIIINLARGRTPDCHCFGRLHSEPVGWTTVARNAALAAFAGFVVAQGAGHTGPGLVEWLSGLNRTQSMFLGLAIAICALAALQVTMLVQLLAQNGRLMLRIESLEGKADGPIEAPAAVGLPANTEAPTFSLRGLDGMAVTLEALASLGKPLLLFFSEPGCTACETVMPDVARWQRESHDRLLVVPISRGDLQLNRAKSIKYGIEHMLIQTSREVFEAYKVEATPSAVFVKAGQIAGPLAVGPAAIRELVFSATLPEPVKNGNMVPSLVLRDIDNKPLNVGSRRPRSMVLLFWNPSCGFCQAMLNDLKSWERTRSKRAPELVVISTGSVEVNRQQGFRSRVLLDQAFGVGRVFGATGTPSAVLIDEAGRVASDVGVGRPAVLAILGATSVERIPA